jgi:G3E family GTPase
LSRTPVTLLTGYLGSGKTTLLSRLLAHPDMGETAVIVNELGDVAIDHHLLRRVDERTVVLDSGCVCCTLRGDLADELRDLLSRRTRGEIPPFRRVVVETTGLADPAPILYTLVSEPVVKSHFELDRVITTVDAQHGLRGTEGLKQAAAADRLVVTKGDLADPRVLERQLAALNPTADVLEASFGDVEPDVLFGGRDHEPRAVDAELPSQRSVRDGEPLSRDFVDFRAAHADPGSQRSVRHVSETVGGHEEGVHAHSLVFDEPLDWTAFGVWLTMLLAARGSDVLRVKGLLNVGAPGPLLLNGVQHVVHPPEHLDAWPDDDRRSRIVFIGRGFTAAELESSLLAFNRAA